VAIPVTLILTGKIYEQSIVATYTAKVEKRGTARKR